MAPPQLSPVSRESEQILAFMTDAACDGRPFSRGTGEG
jgi:hypothetical protein